jgi:hypothetical protein
MIRSRVAALQLKPALFIAPRLSARNYATPTLVKEEDPQLEGYPKTPAISRQYAAPTGWTDNQERRNFGDVVRLAFAYI